MNEIKLSVDDKDIDTVLNILNNLKNGLITNIETNANIKAKIRSTQYQPKNDKIIKEEDSATNDSSGKYINTASYKQRLKRRITND